MSIHENLQAHIMKVCPRQSVEGHSKKSMVGLQTEIKSGTLTIFTIQANVNNQIPLSSGVA